MRPDGRVAGGETVIRVACVRKEYISNKRGSVVGCKPEKHQRPTFIVALGRYRQGDGEFKSSLGCLVSLRLARATQDPISIKEKLPSVTSVTRQVQLGRFHG